MSSNSPNIQTAIEAIEAEITYAKEGLEYYVSRVKALEQALSELNSVGTESAAPATEAPAKTKRTKQPKPAKTVGKRGRKAKLAGANGVDKTPEADELPFTGGDYWPDLISEQPKHSSAILQAAIDKLGFTPSKTQVKKLAQRMTFSLNALVKANKIKDSGSGRNREFFK